MSSFRRLFKHTLPSFFTIERLEFIRDRAFNITKIIFAAHFLTEYVGEVKLTSGPSMLPTLNVHGDGVYVSKFYRRGRGIKVGDVITLKHPMFPAIGASKRIIGMPGDFVLRDSPGFGSDVMIQVIDCFTFMTFL